MVSFLFFVSQLSLDAIAIILILVEGDTMLGVFI